MAICHHNWPEAIKMMCIFLPNFCPKYIILRLYNCNSAYYNIYSS